jgi:sec-independent protein translocase protein TatA
MGWLGISEIIVILLLVLILFGPQKLPEIGRIIGNGLREFRKATSGFDMEGLLDAKEIKTEKEEQANISEGETSRPIPEKLTESPDPTSQEIIPYEQLVFDINSKDNKMP